jgi:Transglutaminase-like superfamily
MKFKQLLKFYRYAGAWENYVLLWRVIQSALLVRRRIKDQAITPKLKAIFPFIDEFFLVPQKRWRLSDAKKIAWFANFIVNFPFRWGRCLQRSLIVYRLLNGYGMPANVLIGVNRQDATADGHVWVVRASDNGLAFAEESEPDEKYTIIYRSNLP